MKRSLLILALMIAGCDRDRPPAPTSEQSNQLDEAEAMLNDLAGPPPPAANQDSVQSNTAQ